jgi:hypothetical protein
MLLMLYSILNNIHFFSDERKDWYMSQCVHYGLNFKKNSAIKVIRRDLETACILNYTNYLPYKKEKIIAEIKEIIEKEQLKESEAYVEFFP